MPLPDRTGHNIGSNWSPAKAKAYGSIQRLERWVNGDYEGWDPYDGINCDKISSLRGDHTYLKMGLIQFHRLFPINLREAFGVKKGVSTKGIAIILQALLALYSATGREEYLREASRLSEIIIDNSLVDKYGEYAWASHYFQFVSADGIVYTPDNADTIGTCNVLKALSSLHRITKDKRLEEVIVSCQSFMQGMIEQKGDLFYVLYAPHVKGKIVPNASAEALSSIALSLKARWNEELHALSDEVLRSLVALQRSDGSWMYSTYPDGRVYQQLDFHQGYMIGGLLAYREYAPIEVREDVEKAIAGATVFYQGLFRRDGRSIYRAPRKNPVDIHNQAQGIISFIELGEAYEDPSHTDMANRIADWTITHMQDDSGYFYYQKGLLITNKIPYMRWSQAWMMLALSKLLYTRP